jgi:hypothetical protein
MTTREIPPSVESQERLQTVLEIQILKKIHATTDERESLLNIMIRI